MTLLTIQQKRKIKWDKWYSKNREKALHNRRKRRNGGVDRSIIMDSNGEIWMPIPGYSHYSASSSGRIRSKNRLLKPWANKWGYLLVGVVTNAKEHVRASVHRLVMLAFHGESDLHVNHKDFNKQNNAVLNLEYVTPLENHRHSERHGRYIGVALKRREASKSVKLTPKVVVNIFNRVKMGDKQRDLARHYNISPQTICGIMHGRCWSDITRSL